MASSSWRPDSYDSNDKPYRSQAKGVYRTSVDLSAEHSDWLQPIYQQGKTDTCVANATAAAYRFLAHRSSTEQPNGAKFMDDPSRLFLYYNARLLPMLEKQDPTDDSPPKVTARGSENRNCFKGLNLYGVCAETTWPFNLNKNDARLVEHVNKRPEPEMYEEARKFRGIEYCRLDPDHPEELEKVMSLEEREAVGIVTLLQLKQCLSEGFPVVFGFWRYEAPKDTSWIKGDGIWQLPPLPADRLHKGPPMKTGTDGIESPAFPGHTLLAIGYDEERKMVLCQNSLGADWPRPGDNGKFWMPYGWITDWEATDDFWMVRSIAH